MGEAASRDRASEKSFIKGLKTEYNEIIWPDKETVGKQAVAVLAASTTLGLIIALINLIIKSDLSFTL